MVYDITEKLSFLIDDIASHGTAGSTLVNTSKQTRMSLEREFFSSFSIIFFPFIEGGAGYLILSSCVSMSIRVFFLSKKYDC